MPQRLGFAVKVMARADLPSHDARRHQNNPHLRVSLEVIFRYLKANNINMYRMSSDVAPYLTHPDLPQFHRQLDDCADELTSLGIAVRAQGLRLSLHPSQSSIINSADTFAPRFGSLRA